ncbi:putative GTP cyclohydrolase I [Ilyonectria robusta]
MPKSKNGVSKRAYGNTSTSSPTGDDSSWKKRKSCANSLGKAAEDVSYETRIKKAGTPGNGVMTRSPGPLIDVNGIGRPDAETRDRQEENEEQDDERLEKMRGAVRTLLECIGEDADREGLLDTPSRYAKALLSLTKGYQVNLEDTINNALFNEGHNEIVIVKDIDIWSLCEHHLVPFSGKMHIGYIPHNTVIGLSKLPRIAEMFSRRLQIQERLTKEVARTVMDILKPHGVFVVMEASHLCMVIRGVQKTNAKTITSCALGCFERESTMRNEFLNLVGANR